MFRAINAHLQEVTLYTCSIRYCYSLWGVVVADRIQCDLLKMSIHGSTHVEECTILWINNNLCIKLVINIQYSESWTLLSNGWGVCFSSNSESWYSDWVLFVVALSTIEEMLSQYHNIGHGPLIPHFYEIFNFYIHRHKSKLHKNVDKKTINNSLQNK